MTGRLVFRGKSVLSRVGVCQTKRGARHISKSATPTYEEASNMRALVELDKSMRAHNIGESWRWYQELAGRNERETPVNKPLIASAVVPRRMAGSAGIQMMRAHTCMLQALNLRKQFGYDKEDLYKLGAMTSAVLSNVTREGVTLSSAHVNRILRLFTVSGNVQAACQIWQYAALSGVARDVTNYNSMISCLISAKEYDYAFTLVNEMAPSGIQPNSTTHNLRIKLHGLVGDLQAARDLFAYTCGSPGPKPTRKSDKKTEYWADAVEDFWLCGATTVTYNIMLDVLGMNGLVDEMHELLVRMCGLDASGEIPTTETLTRMVREGAVELPRKPLALSIETFHVLIKWHAKYWDLEAVEQYLLLMVACGFKPVPKTFKQIITHETVGRDLRKCSELALRMVTEYGLKPSAFLVRMLERATEENNAMKEKIKMSEKQGLTSLFGFSWKSKPKDPL
ncbi:hypothetical protein LPJ59_000151 [Coemansia sp. RSA 2399]|nr:hypothetical protein LPJ59_000151 [Coemansia sp. RSA 2399]KAJ1908196.1 hypothetical protein LPJ81_000272 [Coemansia sp. IMI 209127]